ncbi:hypothetical protein [Bacillus sp. UMB0728]|uniref:hypothetical protein n=1 Tax=Bacillus sp. UMB0728 TaxID=2066052 RepID=UPI000C7872BF|nr:hypothetical protein [Bacillus sp. UMB0728]PLR72197.1 hypothetical protein CYJ37_11615 [Bacillus sp. UMB0728]
MKLLKATQKALQQYKETVKGNNKISTDEALKKLTRNVRLVKESAPERIALTWKGLKYSYGNLDITVRFGKVIEVVNHKDYRERPDDWDFPKKRYIELNKELGITDCKFSKKKKSNRVS